MAPTTSNINLGGITTDANGKVRVSGLSSSIDWKSIVDTQITVKRAPAVQLETKITKNQELVTAYSELKTKTGSLAASLNALRAAPGSSADVFKSKVASGTTAAALSAPSGFVASNINSLLLTSIGSAAQTGTHTVKITQTAAAQQIRSDAITSTSLALSALGVTAGTFTLGGKTITVSATDTLQDVRASINAANAGVNATIVSASPTSHYLVLTSSDTGVANEMVFGGGGTATSDTLGLTNAGVVKTQLTAARDAILDVDGITGITRSSNSIADIITGVTLNLLKAESNTDITLKVEADLNTIKTAIDSFVTAYNDIRSYYTEQRTASDRNADGTVNDNELGPLAYDQRLRDIVGKMGELVASSIDGNTDGYRSLSQLGISIESDYSLKINDATLDARLLNDVDEVRNLFGFTSTVSDSRLTVLNKTSATQSGTYYLNIAGTDASSNVNSANFRTTAGAGAGGLNDGSASSGIGGAITALNGPNIGLGVLFTGAPNLGPVDDIAITLSRGLADGFYDYFNDLTKTTTGGFDVAVTGLLTLNADYESRISTIDDRLVFTRATLEARFVKMETALARLESLKSTINSYFSSNNSSS